MNDVTTGATIEARVTAFYRSRAQRGAPAEQVIALTARFFQLSEAQVTAILAAGIAERICRQAMRGSRR